MPEICTYNLNKVIRINQSQTPLRYHISKIYHDQTISPACSMRKNIPYNSLEYRIRVYYRVETPNNCLCLYNSCARIWSRDMLQCAKTYYCIMVVQEYGQGTWYKTPRFIIVQQLCKNVIKAHATRLHDLLLYHRCKNATKANCTGCHG